MASGDEKVVNLTITEKKGLTKLKKEIGCHVLLYIVLEIHMLYVFRSFLKKRTVIYKCIAVSFLFHSELTFEFGIFVIFLST